MRNTLNNILLVVGIVIAASTLPIINIFTGPISDALCVDQNLEDTVVCTPNLLPAILITFFVPLVVGTVCIALSVLFRKR